MNNFEAHYNVFMLHVLTARFERSFTHDRGAWTFMIRNNDMFVYVVRKIKMK